MNLILTHVPLNEKNEYLFEKNHNFLFIFKNKKRKLFSLNKYEMIDYFLFIL